jgi:hypothetical protein
LARLFFVWASRVSRLAVPLSSPIASSRIEGRFTGLIFSVLLIGVVLVVRIYGMEVDSTVRQSLPLVKSEIVLVVISLVGIAIEIGRRSYARRTVPFPGAATVA